MIYDISVDLGAPGESNPTTFCVDELGRSLPAQRQVELVGVGLHARLDHVEGTVVCRE